MNLSLTSKYQRQIGFVSFIFLVLSWPYRYSSNSFWPFSQIKLKYQNNSRRWWTLAVNVKHKWQMYLSSFDGCWWADEKRNLRMNNDKMLKKGNLGSYVHGPRNHKLWICVLCLSLFQLHSLCSPDIQFITQLENIILHLVSQSICGIIQQPLDAPYIPSWLCCLRTQSNHFNFPVFFVSCFSSFSLPLFPFPTEKKPGWLSAFVIVSNNNISHKLA